MNSQIIGICTMSPRPCCSLLSGSWFGLLPRLFPTKLSWSHMAFCGCFAGTQLLSLCPRHQYWSSSPCTVKDLCCTLRVSSQSPGSFGFPELGCQKLNFSLIYLAAFVPFLLFYSELSLGAHPLPCYTQGIITTFDHLGLPKFIQTFCFLLPYRQPPPTPTYLMGKGNSLSKTRENTNTHNIRTYNTTTQQNSMI